MYSYILESFETIGRARRFRFFPKEEGITFSPGQFVKVSKPDNSLGRPYSIASPPSWEFLEFLININVGEFTTFLGSLDVGSEVLISKPAGHMVYNNEEKAVFITGGTGIAPIMSMIRHIVINKIKGEFHLFYSARSIQDMGYYDELRTYSDLGIINFHPYLTRRSANIKGVKNKRIDLGEVEEKIGNLTEFSYFMCGKNAFVFPLRTGLIEKGVDKTRIKVEGWG